MTRKQFSPDRDATDFLIRLKNQRDLPVVLTRKEDRMRQRLRKAGYMEYSRGPDGNERNRWRLTEKGAAFLDAVEAE